MSNLDLSLVGDHELQLPFKPFTRAEVEAITQAPSQLIDAWWGNVLEERIADMPGVMPGLDYMQTFAVFVGHRWLHEGADLTRATGVVIFVGNLGKGIMLDEFRMGNTFPAPTPQGGILIPHGRLKSLGERCNLERLYKEFLSRIEAVFPSSKK